MPRKTHLLRVLEIVHRNASGGVIHEARDILNVVHSSGEEFMLGALFGGEPIPELYYFGLDSRSAVAAADDIGDIQGKEPSANGYERQSVGSSEFALALTSSGSWQASGPTVLFRAVGGSWGPVRNIFLCTGLGYTAPALMSSVAIGQDLTVLDGETVTMRMAMSLSGC